EEVPDDVLAAEQVAACAAAQPVGLKVDVETGNVDDDGIEAGDGIRRDDVAGEMIEEIRAEADDGDAVVVPVCRVDAEIVAVCDVGRGIKALCREGGEAGGQGGEIRLIQRRGGIGHIGVDATAR